MKYTIKRFDMRNTTVPPDRWFYGPVRWLVYLGPEHVETFDMKFKAVKYILDREYPRGA